MIGIEELQVNNRYAQTYEHCFLCFLDLIVLNGKVGHNITVKAILNQIIRIVYW